MFVDPFGRKIEYLRLSVTDQCHIRCFYCRPKNHPTFEPDETLTLDEMSRIVAAFARGGVHHVRLTGGEPLLRRNLATLAGTISDLPGIKDLSLSTNGLLLARQADALAKAGVRRANVSLDTLDPERYSNITGGAKLEQVLAGLQAARRAGFAPIKINMVALKGVNDDEFDAMVDFCVEHEFTLRFIELMPVGAGQAASDHFLDLTEVERSLSARYNLVPSSARGSGPARYLRVAGTKLDIGFITPLSQHFCAGCNRVRLTADGTLHLCLGHEHRVGLRDLMRSGCSDEELEAAIAEAIKKKPERHVFRENPYQVVRFMATTGG